MKKVIINGTLVLRDQLVKSNLYLCDDLIEKISNELEDGYEVIDAKGLYVSPGFVDVHTHGRNNEDTMNGTFEAIDVCSINEMKTGVTSFCPTTMTQSIEATQKAIQAVASYKGQENGAKVIGVHMEGPFIETSKKGAQPGKYVLKPSIEAFNDMVGDHMDDIALITVAPEVEGMKTLIPYLVNHGVTVSMGHTNATYEDAKVGFSYGVSHATHTFNAMTAFTHRAPGAVGAVFENDDIYAELILDGIHVHFGAAKTLVREKGVGHVCLVTDSMEAAGLGNGEYALGGQKVFVHDGQARLADGTLAGSVLCLNQAVKNAYHHLNLPLYDAVRMASLSPAKSVKAYDIGEIAPNKKADIVFFNDNIDIQKVIINGKEVL